MKFIQSNKTKSKHETKNISSLISQSSTTKSNTKLLIEYLIKCNFVVGNELLIMKQHTYSRQRPTKSMKSGSLHLSAEDKGRVPGLRFLPLLFVTQRGLFLESVGNTKILLLITNKLI